MSLVGDGDVLWGRCSFDSAGIGKLFCRCLVYVVAGVLVDLEKWKGLALVIWRDVRVWFMVTVLKTVACKSAGGSNPSLSAGRMAEW